MTDAATRATTGEESKAIEHLREAVEQNSTPYVIVSHRAVADVLKDLAGLRTEREALRGALVALVDDEAEGWHQHWRFGQWECLYCEAVGAQWNEDPRESDHKDDCRWAKARRLVAAPPAPVATGEEQGR